MESSDEWSSLEDFEFNTCAAGVDVKGADDLFYKGQLLPLALPPRLQMVHNLSIREGECEEATAAAAAAAASAATAPWLRVACPSAAPAMGDEAMVRARQQRGRMLSLRAAVPPPAQQQLKSPGFRSHDTVGSRHFWGDSSAQPSSDSSADSSSEARDSSGSSKDSVDLSAPEKGDVPTSSSNSQCGYTGGQRGRHDKFFHSLVGFGGKTGAQNELPGGHGDGRHARVFSWLKPASSRWNGIFGGSKKAGHAAKKMAAMEDEADGRVRSTSASLARPASPPRDSSSSDDVPTPQLRLRHSGPLASCDDEFLVNCRDRLSGPLSFRGSATRDSAHATTKCDWDGMRASHDLVEERREWQSMHSSFRESAGEPFMPESISAVDGHHSGREHWRMNPSFNYEDACNEEQQVPVVNDASRSSDKASKRRNCGTLATDSGGRHRYLDKLFRSFHVKIPLKSSESLPKTKSSRRNQTSSNVPMMLNPICSTSTEVHSSIQGAIAYCKRSQSSCKPKGAPTGKKL